MQRPALRLCCKTLSLLEAVGVVDLGKKEILRGDCAHVYIYFKLLPVHHINHIRRVVADNTCANCYYAMSLVWGLHIGYEAIYAQLHLFRHLIGALPIGCEFTILA